MLKTIYDDWERGAQGPLHPPMELIQ